jgi:UrcA family protein
MHLPAILFGVKHCHHGLPIQLGQEISMKTSIDTPSKNVKSIVAASFIALGCAAIGGQALAQQAATVDRSQDHANNLSVSPSSVTYPLRFSDLDVSKMKGAKTLYLRIRYAAGVVCESAATWGKKQGDACVQKAVNDAVTRVNAPVLTQYSQRRSKTDRARPVQLANAT